MNDNLTSLSNGVIQIIRDTLGGGGGRDFVTEYHKGDGGASQCVT
jgi:hypothetical protein